MKEKNKDEVVEAYPNVGLFNDILIKDKKIPISIGGFSLGGFYLKSPYELVEETRNTMGDDLTYYKFKKSKDKMSKAEEIIRKREQEDLKYKKKLLETAKKDVERWTKEIARIERG